MGEIGGRIITHAPPHLHSELRGRYLNADSPHGGPSCGPHSSILKRVRHLRTAGQGHIENDALAMIFFVPVLDDHIDLMPLMLYFMHAGF